MKTLLHITFAVILLIASVTTAGATPTGEAIANAIADMYQLDRSTHEIEILKNTLKVAEVAEGELTVRPMTSKDPLGLFSIKAIVTIDGQTIESTQVRLRIKRFAEVLVATDRIGRHKEFGADNLELIRMEVTNLREQAVVSLDELVGHRSKRNIMQGTILTTSAIELIPDVEPGKLVDIVYADGICRITAPGTIMQPGSAGEYVRVKNKSSNKIIIARVVDSSAVAVDP